MKPRRPLAIIGIDPSAQAGGYCVDLGDRMVFGTARIDEVGGLPFDEWDADRVVVCIECPTRMYRGSNHVVRSASRLWMDRIRRAYPRRTVLVGSKTGFVDPDAWRKMVLANAPGEDWKAKALWYCRITAPHITDHNQAEAFCIMRFARDAYRLRVATPPKNARNKRAK